MFLRGNAGEGVGVDIFKDKTGTPYVITSDDDGTFVYQGSETGFDTAWTPMMEQVFASDGTLKPISYDASEDGDISLYPVSVTDSSSPYGERVLDGFSDTDVIEKCLGIDVVDQQFDIAHDEIMRHDFIDFLDHMYVDDDKFNGRGYTHEDSIEVANAIVQDILEWPHDLAEDIWDESDLDDSYDADEVEDYDEPVSAPLTDDVAPVASLDDIAEDEDVVPEAISAGDAEPVASGETSPDTIDAHSPYVASVSDKCVYPRDDGTSALRIAPKGASRVWGSTVVPTSCVMDDAEMPGRKLVDLGFTDKHKVIFGKGGSASQYMFGTERLVERLGGSADELHARVASRSSAKIDLPDETMSEGADLDVK